MRTSLSSNRCIRNDTNVNQSKSLLHQEPQIVLFVRDANPLPNRFFKCPRRLPAGSDPRALDQMLHAHGASDRGRR
jgi:hypothetical protein